MQVSCLLIQFKPLKLQYNIKSLDSFYMDSTYFNRSILDRLCTLERFHLSSSLMESFPNLSELGIPFLAQHLHLLSTEEHTFVILASFFCLNSPKILSMPIRTCIKYIWYIVYIHTQTCIYSTYVLHFCNPPQHYKIVEMENNGVLATVSLG